MKTTDFYTVPRSEEGVRVPLLKADGQDSGEWLLIRGVHSKVYAAALTELRRRKVEAQAARNGTDDRANEIAEAAVRDFACALIMDWSFDEPFTRENVMELLKNAPGIRYTVDVVASDASRFFGPASPSSTPGQKSKSSSEEATADSPPSD